MDLSKLIFDVFSGGGTEIYLKIGSPPLVRQNNYLKSSDSPPLTRDEMQSFINKMLATEEKKKFSNDRFFEGFFSGNPPVNFRLNLFQAQSQTVVKIRMIPKAVPGFDELGLPVAIDRVVNSRRGLFILSGPSRSGISTSLAALVERINRKKAAHIVLIEDPIEFYFESRQSRISQRQFRKDIISIDQAINFAKRMDADIVVIGDLKDELPFQTILNYVSGGHFVIMTMQTLGITNTLDKIIRSFSSCDSEHVCSILAGNLIGVCSQFLVPTASSPRLVPVHEILMMNDSIKTMIQKGRISQIETNIISAGEGSRLFEHDVEKYLAGGFITKEAAATFASMLKGLKA